MRSWACSGLLASMAFAAFGQTATSAKFDAADVHISDRAANPYTYVSGGLLRGERYDLRKATMIDLYGVSADYVLGGPNWLELDRFDIAAKAPASTPPATVNLMLQSLLAERFHLMLHKDTKPLPAFVLTAGKDKPKIKEAVGSGSSGCQYQQQPAGSSEIVYFCRNITMDAFAKLLRGMASDYLTNPVMDATGIAGVWDFDLKWNRRAQLLPGGERNTIFDAIGKQLGLMLELKTAPAPVLVVDRVNETPISNPEGTAQKLPPRPVEFEVADLKPSQPDAKGSFGVKPGGTLEARAVEMKILIATAWDIDWDHVDKVLLNAPKWMDSARFDILAKPSVTTTGTAPAGNGFIDDETRLMLRALLIERFQMKTHYEDRPGDAYSLVSIKPKLRRADPSNRSSCKEARSMAKDPRDANPMVSRLMVCQNVTMAQFAKQLQRLLPDEFANEVANATGMEGYWDFTLNFTPAYLLRGGGTSGDAAATLSDPRGGLSLSDAMKRQLGLKLELRKRMIPMLVFDHIEEKPTDN